MREAVTAALLALATAACTPGPLSGDGGGTSPLLVIDGKPVLGNVAVVDGAYTWTAVRPPKAGAQVYAIVPVPGTSDAWLLGTAIERWNGSAVTARFEVPEVTIPRPGLGVLDSAAVIAPNDIWACGSHLMHFDGTTWTDETARLGLNLPSVPGGCFVAGPSAGRVHVLGSGLWTIENGVITALPDVNFTDESTGSTLMSNSGFAWRPSNAIRNCLVALPTGQVGILGLGIVKPVNNQLQVQRQWRMDGMSCKHARFGDTLYLLQSANDAPVKRAELASEWVTWATLSKSAAEAQGLQSLWTGGAPGFLAAHAGGVVLGVQSATTQAIDFGLLIDVSGPTPTYLADRFYGYRFFAAQLDATGLLVAVQGGGLFKGVKR